MKGAVIINEPVAQGMDIHCFVAVLINMLLFLEHEGERVIHIKVLKALLVHYNLP